MKQPTKQEKTYIKNIQKKIGKTIFANKLIQENDKVLVGLSGGKDSLILLHALASRKKYLPFKYELIAAHINVLELNYQADISFLKEFCEKNDVKFYKKDISITFEPKKKVSPCFICSWHRRAELFKLANKIDCNKLAFGHHLDDAIETLLMNMSFNGEISSLPYKVSMFKGRMDIIRPMLDTEEKQFIKYADLMNFHNKQIKTCQYEKATKRTMIKDILRKIETHNKDAKKNIYRSMFKIIPEYLPKI